MPLALLAFATACGRDEPDRLVLDGPTDVRVTELGPVDGPDVRLTSGDLPDGLIWTLSRSGVARIEDGRVIAEGPGQVEVAAEWEGARVSWTLAVELDTTVSFVGPPSSLRVGEVQPLLIAAQVGDQTVEPGPIQWATSDPAVLVVDPNGTAIAAGAGTAYVTATTNGGNAMVEIEVVP
jgi:hypothetical protein